MRQISFQNLGTVNPIFGGSLILGRRKSRRPLSYKKPIHLVLKSENAKGRLAFANSFSRINSLLYKCARGSAAKVYCRAIHFNHIHCVIKFESREGYVRFIRIFTADVVAHFSAKTSRNLKGFFTHRPWTRILDWGRSYFTVKRYVSNNVDQVKSIKWRETFVSPEDDC